MSFSCGCFVVPRGEIKPEMLRQHLQHTFEVMLFWELLGRRINSADRIGTLRLSHASQEFMEAVTALYPEAVQEKDQATVRGER